MIGNGSGAGRGGSWRPTTLGPNQPQRSYLSQVSNPSTDTCSTLAHFANRTRLSECLYQPAGTPAYRRGSLQEHDRKRGSTTRQAIELQPVSYKNEPKFTWDVMRAPVIYITYQNVTGILVAPADVCIVVFFFTLECMYFNSRIQNKNPQYRRFAILFRMKPAPFMKTPYYSPYTPLRR